MTVEKPHDEQSRDVHEPPQPGQIVCQGGDDFRVTAKRRMVASEPEKLCEQRLQAAARLLQSRELSAERLVDVVGLLLLRCLRLEGDVVAKECIKRLFRPAKEPFQLAPIRLVERSLLILRQPHQHEVADEVGLTQVDAG